MQDYKHTAEDLKIMQSWSLDRKIMVTQAKITEFYSRTDGKCYISFSGGKDSTVLLKIARQCFPDIEAVFVDTRLEYPEVRNFALAHKNVKVLKPEMRFDEIIRKYGWCFPSKNVSKRIESAKRGSELALNCFKGVNPDGTKSYYRQTRFNKWEYLIDIPVNISSKCCYYMKEKPFRKYERESGKRPVIGTMASESARRKQSWYITGCNNFDKGKQASKPLSFWTEQDILRYLREYTVPYASVYGDIVKNKYGKLNTTRERRTGCILCPAGCHLENPNRFQRLQVTYPKLWDYVINTLNLRELLDYAGVPYEADTNTVLQFGQFDLFDVI